MAESEESARQRFVPGSLDTASAAASQALDHGVEEQITQAMTWVEVRMDLAISFTAAPGLGATVLEITDS
jgi:hypothetical protein